MNPAQIGFSSGLQEGIPMSWFAKLFGKDNAEKPTINSIHLDTSGWQLQQQSKNAIAWMSEDDVVIAVNLTKHLSGLPSMEDLTAVRTFCRQLATGGGKVGGIVYADTIQLQGSSA